MPARNISLTDQAYQMLDQYYEKQSSKNRATLGEIVSQAIVEYVTVQSSDYAEKRIEDIIERRLHQMENGLRSLLSSASIDILMILVDILEQRKEQKELSGEQVRMDFEDLRKVAVDMWKRKRVNNVF